MSRRIALFAATMITGLCLVYTLSPVTPANAGATANIKYKEASKLRVGKASATVSKGYRDIGKYNRMFEMR